jgi:hypothetical protein
VAVSDFLSDEVLLLVIQQRNFDKPTPVAVAFYLNAHKHLVSKAIVFQPRVDVTAMVWRASPIPEECCAKVAHSISIIYLDSLLCLHQHDFHFSVGSRSDTSGQHAHTDHALPNLQVGRSR